MAAIDKAAAFLSQLNPAMQTVGADIARQGAGVLQQGANVLADVGDAAFRRGGVTGNVLPSLVNASNMLHAGSQNLLNMAPGGQAALGYGGVGTAALAAGTAAAGIMRARKGKKERMAGQDLGAQLGVQMPGII
jgi:hypothetical protein